ncbi:TRAP transporter substrate-binding protein [Vibrio cincinnatiensis]|uniref:TRAP-type C4-dicarboxylate transport system, substrate-binding protein n=1 Tax=Vibrio cincinnatiensis DSM 19608 TaxID=1123491 RepID=A0A1T4RV94_VIBCI|nr:TRAP transporter substrate-binding protein [Vibrio cincinnatiensis]MCG3766104.1 TRAP transporter substrate-binding protein [Vibrio cincinnatiensis]SKA19934.1 TRAP-type C4-dicarboxylate transport system, substrate-binding protein [Vibrio cincinnatiensis DSM 19608]SUP49041.1 TRAP-type C4-dicarboxylate transport system, periplasmic component [Vibrio cincinnatiensis]
MFKSNLVKASLGLITSTLFLTQPAFSSQHELKIATWLSPMQTMNSDVLPTWGKWIEAATEGRVTIKLEYDLAHPKSLIELVEDGAVDAAWTFHGYLPGRFRLSQLAELPGNQATGEAASVAHWRVHKQYFTNSFEYEGVEIVGFFVHGPGQVHMREPINSLKDLKGKKIRVGGGISTEVGKLLEVSGVSAPATKAYEMLSQGVADGLFMQMDMMKAARFKDVAPYSYKLPTGLYLGSFGIFISPQFMDKLSKEDQEAIRAVSGDKLSALAGRYWAKADDIGEADIIASGSQVSNFSSEEVTYFNQLIQGLDEQWIQSVKSRKVDAKAALTEFRHIVSNYEPMEL